MNKKLGAAGVLFAIVCLSFCLTACSGTSYLQETELSDSSEVGSEEETADSETSELLDSVSEGIYVQISGAVVNPGVYHLPEDARVYLAIEMAGGLREDACADDINQAALLADGQMLVIPTAEEAAAQKEAANAQASGTETTSSSDGLVNINTATKEELMTLSGIGEAKADAIIEYRTANGAFRTTEDIMNISGIKEGAYSKIKDSITVQ